jgi:hypothetical protein
VKLRLCSAYLSLTALILLPAPSWCDDAADALDVQTTVEVGYEASSSDGNPNRAVEYRYLDSGPVLGLQMLGSTGLQHFLIDGRYLNDNDYRAEVNLDHGGLARLDLRTERLFHNLDHIPYDPSAPEARKPGVTGGFGGGETRVIFSDQDPGANYGIRVETDEVRFRGKLKSMPAHLNLGYWRLDKSGKRQLRFVDEGNDNPAVAGTCNQCHMQSKTRDIDRVTEEVSAGFDAHLGYVDLIFEQIYRQFRDQESIPVDTFNGHMLRPGARTLQHDEDPDSKLAESTVKLHTSLSGGIVGAASFTIGERENRSDLAGQPVGVDGVEAETDYYKATGDMTLMPSPHWTVNFRYRLFDADSDNPGQISAYDKTFPVRENVDLRRANYEAIAAHRPTRNLTLKAEYQREDLHRGNTGGPEPHHGFSAPIPFGGVTDAVWELPEDEVLQRYKVSFLYRPFGSRAVKVHSWYQYRTSDDPAYGASFEDRREIFFGTTYAPAAPWGVNLSAKALKDVNNGHQEFLFDAADNPTAVFLDRKREQQDVSIGLWANPLERLSVGANYGYLRSRIRQDLLFGTDLGNPPAVANHSIEDELVEYSQRVHTVSANVAWRIIDNLTGRLDGYHIRSFAEFSPNFDVLVDANGIPLGLPANSDGLKGLSRVAIRQNGLRAGLDWKMTQQWGSSFTYTYDDYEDRDSSVFDGTAQTYMASVSRTW